jgi:hypothetical protein
MAFFDLQLRPNISVNRIARKLASSAVTGKQGNFGRLFCPWRFYVLRGKVTLGLGRSFTSVPVSVLTLHSSGTGRMRSLHGLRLLNFRGSGQVLRSASPSI